MNFFKFLQRRHGKASSDEDLPPQGRNGKVSSDEDLLGFDLLFQLSYMSAIAAAGITRSHIFELASQLDVSSSGYFRKIHLLNQKMNYGYAEACRLVGESTKREEVKSLLLRLSASLSSGQAEKDFLAQEAEVQAETYGDEYERRLETLRKWTDGYIALLVSAALIVVVAVVSMMIYSMGTSVVAGLVGTMDAIGFVGTFIIYRAAPKEIKPLPAAMGPAGLRLCRSLLYILAPAGAMVCGLLLLRGVATGWIFVVAAVFLFPIGIMGVLFDRKVDKRDEEISTFLRSVGRVASAIGTTVAEALDRIDNRSMGSLAPAIKKLRIRLHSKIKPELCWRSFVVETESELVNRSVTMFEDAVHMGGDPEVVAFRCSFLAMKVHLLRAKRRIVCSTFANLCLVMHATVVGLLVFIIEIVRSFGKMVETIDVDKLMQGVKQQETMVSIPIFSFSLQDMQFFYSLLIPAILVLCVINAFAAKIAEGGSNYKLFYYAGITLATSGAAMLFVPKLTSMLFQITSS